MRFTWDEKPLSKKEADDLAPKLEGALRFLFKHVDRGITATNRDKAKAEIWSAIDDEDLGIIVSHLVDMATASKVVATVVRKTTNSFKMVQLGLITAPKFLATVQHYQKHGGFVLVPGLPGRGK